MKQFITGVVAALVMGVMAETTNTVKVTKFHQLYPYSGKATVEYTVGGTLPANAIAEITLNTDDARATFTQKNIVTGANKFMIDFAPSFGGALLLTNASFMVTITEDLGGVQLWENGPYWAECNVGASKPEEYGYYFWWGDTVGYARTGGTWNDHYYSGVTWVSSTGERMSSSPFTSSCPTYGKDNSALLSAGYIDSTSNLVAAHDAAIAHLGSPWRMPTAAELDALISNCATTWITTNGVNGRLVTGKGDYADRSIFLPAAGYGDSPYLIGPGSGGYYWSSTPDSDISNLAWFLRFNSSYFYLGGCSPDVGQSVRPVRGFGESISVVGIVTYDPSETQTTVVPVPYAWLRAHDPTVADEYEAYEAAAKKSAANGRMSVAECYVLGLDPQVATSDFRIVSFPMKADGTPDLANIVLDPPQEQWNVQGAQMVLKCAAKLTGPWWTVPAEGGSPGTTRPTTRFFKAVVLLGDAQDDPGIVQLWEGGPYWAKTNIGAEEPWEYGYYFWWGDTVGYKRENNAWVASDGSSSNFAFNYNATTPLISQQTHNKRSAALQSEGWITADNVLAPEHDAAQVHWGGGWRMPTKQDLEDLKNNCDWSWATNVVKGYIVCGRDEYAAASIFIPASGHGYGSSLYDLGSFGNYWSSTPGTGNYSYSWYLNFTSGTHYTYYCDYRYYGFPVRPVRESAQ